MQIAKNYKKHIYCLEGNWADDLRQQSGIYSSLNFLKDNCDIKNIYRHCGTKETLFFYLNKWKLKTYYNYSICYLAFHGHEGEICIGKETVSLEEIGEVLSGKCKDKIIFFGSCLVLQVGQARISNFLHTTGALCVCGYKATVNFLESSVFEMLVIDMFQKYKDIGCVQRDIDLYYDKLSKELNFSIYTL